MIDRLHLTPKQKNTLMHVFIQWMSYHNSLDNWMTAILTVPCHDDITHERQVSIRMDAVTNFPFDAIVGAFSWDGSVEGHEYWASLNNEWCDEVIIKLLKEIGYEDSCEHDAG